MDALLTYLVTVALIDSINPNAIAVQIYLLSTPKPIKRSLSFIVGDFLTNLIAGLLITFGLSQVIFQIFSRFSEIFYLFQFLLGIALVLLGCYFYKVFSREKNIKKSNSLKPIHAFFLGVTIALSEAPTALPYLAAIEKIAQKNLSFSQIIELLTIYNLVFICPLIVLLLIYLCFQQESVVVLDYIQLFVNRWIPKIMRLIVVIFGLVLIVDSIVYMSNRFLLMD
jgi:cytochrome c biogenesis protein CcdA